MDNTVLSWLDFEADVTDLVSKIPKGKYKKLLVVTSGGLIPAYYLARLLDIKNIETVGIQTYEGKIKIPSNLIKNSITKEVAPSLIYHKNIELEQVEPQEECLVIDDLIDTGDTIAELKNRFPKLDVAVVYRKPHSPDLQQYCSKTLSGWVSFPWDK